MVLATNLGFPRIGPKRELKRALESYWAGKSTLEELLGAGRQIRRLNWDLQKASGLDQIPCNDFSFYDHVLDAVCMVGAIPKRYRVWEDRHHLDRYFAMARGYPGSPDGRIPPLPAMEMTKWFDTNYHYIVPEWSPEQTFRWQDRKVVEEFQEARTQGVPARPVLLGPLSLILLGKSQQEGFFPLRVLDAILGVYEEVLQELQRCQADWVQMDEPCLVLDLPDEVREGYSRAYERLSRVPVRLLVATYFEGLGENLATALSLPVAGLHLDLVRAPGQLEEVLAQVPSHLSLSLGVVDGRNVWRTDLDRALELLERAAERLGAERLMVAPSCSLLHVPVDLDLETNLDPELRRWLAFGRQKLQEVVLLTRAMREGKGAVQAELEEAREALRSRSASRHTYVQAVRRRLAAVTETMLRRHSSYAQRRPLQRKRLALPLLPTTTIGSFPQTPEVRRTRADFRAGKITADAYEAFLREQIAACIQFQEEISLDVLVHGEFERADMVEYFGEQLAGFALTENGWVQSYGSRYVKPPIIFGDVYRPQPMTIRWITYAQSLTAKPVKGMLTGPVTLLQWSFVRNDQPRSETCRQIALAIRDEVLELEAAGIRVIQIDEPALREGLPLRKADRPRYLRWAVDCFRLASSGVRDETQIHTHMCYSEFNDIIDAIAAMDADVVSIEASRSQMELLKSFRDFKYPNEIGPGVYDIHSPRIPSVEEIEGLLWKALEVLKPEQLWVNPDCGLKTRRWEEVKPSLRHMVEAAQRVRNRLMQAAGVSPR
jgi:5-methyltetrahydropteroyltriglutamate--homocysteine methyltransferase